MGSHSALQTAGPDVRGRALPGFPSLLPLQHPLDPRLSKRGWQEPGKDISIVSTCTEEGEVGFNLQMTHAYDTPPLHLPLPLESSKPYTKPETNHKQVAPLSNTHLEFETPLEKGSLDGFLGQALWIQPYSRESFPCFLEVAVSQSWGVGRPGKTRLVTCCPMEPGVPPSPAPSLGPLRTAPALFPGLRMQ